MRGDGDHSSLVCCCHHHFPSIEDVGFSLVLGVPLWHGLGEEDLGSNRWNAASLMAQVSRQGCELDQVLLANLDLKCLDRLLKVCRSFYGETAIRLLVDRALLLDELFDVVLVVDLSDHLFKDVFHGNYPCGTPVLIHHYSHVDSAQPHLLQRIPHRHRLRHIVRRIHDVGNSTVLNSLHPSGLVQVIDQTLCKNHSNYIVDVVVVDRNSAVSALRHSFHKRSDACRCFHRHDFNPWLHDGCHKSILQVQHTLYHVLLLRSDFPADFGAHHYHP
mmetsp:Transcript_40647/g.128166  ORF Transcript_40647/g.128166 Transcript_40647/m.128166 type:complete len:274 (-) Transcript_40647:1174-1995(-)